MINDIQNFNIMTTNHDRQIRLNLCNDCSENKKINDIAVCFACACPIEYVTTQKYKECPLHKWTIS